MTTKNLIGKTIVFDGDSICHATSEIFLPGSTNRGWAGRIGDVYQMNWYNLGISGGTITAEMYSAEGYARHWISRNIDKIYNEFPDLDYLILEGGTNDADLIAKDGNLFGKYDVNDYSGDFDDSTFCGACDAMFFKAKNYFPNAKLGFIIAPKMGSVSNCAQNNDILKKRRHYFEIIKVLCLKWDIPCLDLWEKSILNPQSKEYYDETLGLDGNKMTHKAYMDGQHLTAKGYDLITPLIEEWILSL